MYRITTVFILAFVVSCGAYRGASRAQSRVEKEPALEEALTIEEYCTYCMGEGQTAALSRLKTVAYETHLSLNVRLKQRELMRDLIVDWIKRYDVEYASDYFSQWFGYKLNERSAYGVAAKVVDGIYSGELSHKSLERINPNLPAVAYDVYRKEYQREKLGELARKIDAYTVEPHGVCGVCVKEEEDRARKAQYKEILSR